MRGEGAEIDIGRKRSIGRERIERTRKRKKDDLYSVVSVYLNGGVSN